MLAASSAQKGVGGRPAPPPPRQPALSLPSSLPGIDRPAPPQHSNARLRPLLLHSSIQASPLPAAAHEG
ncbi:hypothetical protein V496_08285 [Pseudogymnoascus sp. VKM F-4515 (FW-2607)]|nr:hypothetical protein V496_08285 [Pseudogymnoascus sp. VKM F-4515 (FW-2607)]KFY95905.1 hypothetical protein V498_03048 [Pseudogymnoascus sp. VKM F-4517 (FW-2822)]